jgi:hypothetical protein
MRRACLAPATVFDPTILDALEQVELLLAPDRKSPQGACVRCREMAGRSLKSCPTFEEQDVYIAYRGLSVEVADAAERIRGGRRRAAHYMCLWAGVRERRGARPVC